MDRLEIALSNKLQIIRINVRDPEGKLLASEFRVQNVPTFIFFDNKGTEQWRSVGHLDYNQVVSSTNANVSD